MDTENVRGPKIMG